MRFPLPRAQRGAFSLVELIVVITIIGIISMFVIPAATTIIMGSDITRASQVITGQLSLARQTATTRNHSVEVRFLSYADPEKPGESPADTSTWKYRGIQLMEVFDNGNMALLGKIERLPGAVMMDDGRFSSLLCEGGEAESGQQPLTLWKADQRNDAPPLPRVAQADAKKYQYKAFRFRPDGSTDLAPTGKWYITVYSANDAQKVKGHSSTSGPPPMNYFTTQIDPSSGSLRNFRPTAGSKDVGGTAGSGNSGT